VKIWVTNWQYNIHATLIVGAHDHCVPRDELPERPDVDHVGISDPDDMVKPHRIAFEYFFECAGVIGVLRVRRGGKFLAYCTRRLEATLL
jgi:hypothetical protein